MELRRFGDTGLRVSALGFGAGHIGAADGDEHEIARLLDAALDAGVRLLDSARGYGLSEERIGRHLGARRQDVVLSTKCGYGIEGEADWTGACVVAGVDAALRRLRTDRVEVMHLHSCDPATLARDDIHDAVDTTRAAGKVLVWAYSGDNDALEMARCSGRFGALQASVNLCDQRALDATIPAAAASGLGVIAKRPLANAPWRFAERPTGDYAEAYWERLRALDLDPAGRAWDELALRFAAFAPGVSSAIVGTSRLEHLLRAADLVALGPLPDELVTAIRGAFAREGAAWEGRT